MKALQSGCSYILFLFMFYFKVFKNELKLTKNTTWKLPKIIRTPLDGSIDWLLGLFDFLFPHQLSIDQNVPSISGMNF